VVRTEIKNEDGLNIATGTGNKSYWNEQLRSYLNEKDYRPWKFVALTT
jgi:hypothetical protein